MYSLEVFDNLSMPCHTSDNAILLFSQSELFNTYELEFLEWFFPSAFILAFKSSQTYTISYGIHLLFPYRQRIINVYLGTK